MPVITGFGGVSHAFVVALSTGFGRLVAVVLHALASLAAQVAAYHSGWVLAATVTSAPFVWVAGAVSLILSFLFCAWVMVVTYLDVRHQFKDGR